MIRRGILGIALALVVSTVLVACSGQQDQGTTGGTTGNLTYSPLSTAPGDTGDVITSTASAFTAKLSELNDSGVSGNVTVTVAGDKVVVELRARGLEPGRRHPQYVYGYRDGGASRMPSGTVNNREAVRLTGPPLFALRPFPLPNDSGSVVFRQAFPLSQALFPLDRRAVVIHGLMREGSYDATAPVAVGLLRLNDKGATSGGFGGQTGGGQGGGGGLGGGSMGGGGMGGATGGVPGGMTGGAGATGNTSGGTGGVSPGTGTTGGTTGGQSGGTSGGTTSDPNAGGSGAAGR